MALRSDRKWLSVMVRHTPPFQRQLKNMRWLQSLTSESPEHRHGSQWTQNAGETNIKVSSVENISVGDKIRLDIDSEGHGIETVTVTRVGTQSVRSTFNGPLKENEDPGTGLDLAEPLKFDHASNMPFSVRGTGITFEPATKFAHSSNEPVLALSSSYNARPASFKQP